MYCYREAQKDEEGSVVVNNGQVYIKQCELSEDEAAAIAAELEKLELLYEVHWHCSAENDNGIEADEVRDTTTVKPELCQAVLKDGKVERVYIPEHNYAVKIGYHFHFYSSYRDNVSGWGDMSHYTVVYLQDASMVVKF